MQSNQVRILVIDHEESNSLGKMLQSKNYETIVVTSINEALKTLLQEAFAVIVIHELLNTETTKVFACGKSWLQTPIIFIANANDFINFDPEIGICDFIMKPINPVLVQGKVNVFVEIYKKQRELERKQLFLEHKLSLLQGSYKELEEKVDEKTQENHRLKNEILHMDRLQKVGEIAAGIAHEIRNPMTTVLGFLQLSVRGTVQQTPKNIIHLMIDELTRANSIISEYLNLAKIQEFHVHEVDLNKVITAIHPLIQAEAILSEKNVILQLEENCFIMIDDKEIRQLILNLSLNGLEAMEANGNLLVRTYVERDEVVLVVQDEGVGIEEKIMDKISTPFFTTKENGTGLGLAICYQIAEHHNATIEVETSKKGTSFFVRFPRVK